MSETAVDANKQSQRTITARVISNKMNKTVVAIVVRKVAHPVYKKFVNKTTKFYVHDESNNVQVGDVILIEQTRPLSKLKRWSVKEVLEKSAA